jgi:zinc/manganese transport system substrate-binding protein
MVQPSPADARALSEAGLVIVNGLGFEGWLARLIAASGYRGRVVEAAAGADLLPATGQDPQDHREEIAGTDPHCWQSVPNAILYVRRIAQALEEADPGRAAAYEGRARAYEARLADLDHEIRAILAPIPEGQRLVVTSHDAFAYFGLAYGITFVAPVGASTEAEPSARDVARLIRQIRETGARAVFVENVSDPRLVRRIAEETEAVMGGRLYSDALSGPDGPAPTYIDMMRHNARTIAAALTGS